jgi:hypothetical protein
MDYSLLTENLTNPALLFFALGIIAVALKSDLRIPPNSSKFISLYLLFSIGFKGGQELSHETFNHEIGWSMVYGVIISASIPLYSFFILKRFMNVYNAGAVAAAYGSVSAVTFVTAAGFLEAHQMHMHGHMVAIMALMESPAIIVGLLLISMYNNSGNDQINKKQALLHSFTNGSVVLILGSLAIGFLTDDKQAEGIKPFTTDLFKGFLAIFLLDMGITSGKKLNTFFSNGWFPVIFAIVAPLTNGAIATLLSSFFTNDPSNKFMFGVLAASASYIAVPAAMKMAVPKANPGLFLPMTLAITFPVNLSIGMGLYFHIATY